MPAPETRVKPPALRPGDTIGIVAPGSAIQHNLLDAGTVALFRMGYKPYHLDSIYEQDSFFAGSVERRVAELEEMFERDEVRGIICARGGYGCNYLLPELDFEKIARHPKVLVGYSDVTTLLTAITDRCNLVTFHGPMVTKDFAASDGVQTALWTNAVTGKAKWEISPVPSGSMVALLRGKAEGILYGGCLSMLVASLGTAWEIQTEGTVLFMEDVHIKPFQVDRMLKQLRLAGKLSGVRGVILGEFADLDHDSEREQALREIAERILSDLKIPVAMGLRSGHVTRENVTLPLGVKVQLSAQQEVRFTVLEAATAAERPVAEKAGRAGDRT
jgi:muramoyltetrapeptide carboxypeptidase